MNWRNSEWLMGVLFGAALALLLMAQRRPLAITAGRFAPFSGFGPLLSLNPLGYPIPRSMEIPSCHPVYRDTVTPSA